MDLVHLSVSKHTNRDYSVYFATNESLRNIFENVESIIFKL